MIHRSRTVSRVVWQARLAAVAMCVPAAIGAQAPSGAGAALAATTCASVLTQEEAAAIVGDSYAGPAVDEPRPGFTRCEWQGEDSNFGFTFADATALADEMKTAAEMWESEVSAVEHDQQQREPLSGLGQHAALVSLGDDALLVAIARPDGVARMVLYKVSRDKALALAKAIAAP